MTRSVKTNRQSRIVNVLWILVGAVMLLTSCQSPLTASKQSPASGRAISLSWQAGNARTLMPTFVLPSSYDVILKNGATIVDSHTNLSGTNCSFSSLGAINYTVVVNAKNNGQVIATGSAPADLTSQSLVSPVVTLSYITGTGNGQISLSFDTSGDSLISPVPSITIVGPLPATTALTTGSWGAVGSVFSYSNGNVPVGTYAMTATFTNANGVATRAETIVVCQGLTTSNSGSATVLPGDFRGTAALSGLAPMSPQSLVVTQNQTFQVTPIPLNAGYSKVVWTSGNSAIAQVDKDTGLVQPLAMGSTFINATYIDDPSISVNCAVEVYERFSVAGTYHRTISPLEAGRTLIIKAWGAGGGGPVGGSGGFAYSTLIVSSGLVFDIQVGKGGTNGGTLLSVPAPGGASDGSGGSGGGGSVVVYESGGISYLVACGGGGGGDCPSGYGGGSGGGSIGGSGGTFGAPGGNNGAGGAGGAGASGASGLNSYPIASGFSAFGGAGGNAQNAGSGGGGGGYGGGASNGNSGFYYPGGGGGGFSMGTGSSTQVGITGTTAGGEYVPSAGTGGTPATGYAGADGEVAITFQ